MTTSILDQLAAGTIQAPAFIDTVAKDLKAAAPFIGPVESWALGALERWLATRIPPTVAALIVNDILTNLDLPAT